MDRNVGLDIVRSVAIFLVLICHGISAFFEYKIGTNSVIIGIKSVTGILGVEMFFVLSGFLIGRIIIKDIIENPKLSSLKTFYFRRWYRTLPLYYIVLLGIFVAYGHSYYWKHILFLQNYNMEHLTTFALSWSLAIEEWFYLVIPLIFLVGAKIFSKHKDIMFFSVCFTIIILELIVRAVYTSVIDPVYDFQIRKQIHFRMDSLVFGVLLAGIKYYKNVIYNRLSTSKTIMVTSILLFSANVYYIYYLSEKDLMNQSFYARTFSFSLCSIAIMFILAKVEGNKKINFGFNGIISKLFLICSITSYSVYLLHQYVYTVINKVTDILSIPRNYLTVTIIWIIALIACFTLGFIVYRMIEKPIMKFRDRKTKKLNVNKRSIAVR